MFLHSPLTVKLNFICWRRSILVIRLYIAACSWGRTSRHRGLCVVHVIFFLVLSKFVTLMFVLKPRITQFFWICCTHEWVFWIFCVYKIMNPGMNVLFGQSEGPLRAGARAHLISRFQNNAYLMPDMAFSTYKSVGAEFHFGFAVSVASF